MRFRQFLSPTSKNLYDVCLNQVGFYHPEVIRELRPDHNYARPWIDDPTIPTALPRVQLFFSTEPSTDGPIQIDDQSPCNDRSTEAINWAPTMNTLIPERFECPQQSDTPTTTEREAFIGSVRDLIDETRLAALCCELNACDVVYWRLSIHRIVSKLSRLFTDHSNYLNLLDWLHEHICQTFDRTSVGHYVDLFQILYHEYVNIRSAFVQSDKPWSPSSLCFYVYQQVIQKPNDLTEEVIYSLPLSTLPIPMICLIIPGVGSAGHLKRVQFWQRNLSQITTVILSAPIETDHRSEQAQIQSAYDDIIKKFNDIRQLYPNHKIMFLAWNVGCILALKAALACPIATIVCMSLPFLALSDESKNDFTQINGSILFLTGENQSTKMIDRYRQRLKSRNGLIELGQCDDQLRMSEDGKYRFRLTQQMIDKLLMEEMIDFITILSPRSTRPMDSYDEVDGENKRKKPERINAVLNSLSDDAENDIFLYTGDHMSNSHSHSWTTLTIAPEQDPNTVLLTTNLPSATTTRKRKGPNQGNASEQTPRTTKSDTGAKRGRQRTKNLPPIDNLLWASAGGKPPAKSTNKKSKQPMAPTATTSILNTLLQLPTNQPKQRPTEANLLKSIDQPPSFVNTVLSSNSSFL